MQNSIEPFPQNWTLGAIAESLAPATEMSHGEPTGAERTRGCWNRLQSYLACDNRYATLRKRLSIEQELSLHMLCLWFATVRVDATCDLSIAAIEKVYDDALRLDEAKLQSKQWLDYHGEMRKLFQRQMRWGAGFDPLVDAHLVARQRYYVWRRCAIHTYCQLLGRILLYVDSNRGDTTEHSSYDSPIRGVLPAQLLHRASVAAIDRFLRKGPIVDPCPWLEKTVDEWNNWPFYLWDKHNKCVVETRDIGCPEYVAISHTWGRWVKDELVTVTGVQSWKLPQNSRFDVKSLPQILMDVPGDTDYIWLDLLCIPQNKSSIGAREIARQAKIFQNAKHAIAWLNDVEEDAIDELGTIVEWQSLFATEHIEQGEADLSKSRQEVAWAKLLKVRFCLLNPPRIFADDTVEYSPIPWFTSLWTLQEVCLRPDMWLCSRNWCTLKVRGYEYIPVSISGLAALYDVSYDKDGYLDSEQSFYGAACPAISQLITWWVTTGLEELLHLDRAAIITLGDRRQCTGRRAEAIMSALGATKWYTDGISSGKYLIDNPSTLEVEMVLGRYPLPFVKELAQNIPGDFFTSFLKLNTVYRLVRMTPPHGSQETNDSDQSHADTVSHNSGISPPGPGDYVTMTIGGSHGGLLPFSSSPASYYAPQEAFRESHWFLNSQRSLSTWTINYNGSVSMPEVHILRSGHTHTTRIPAVISPVHVEDDKVDNISVTVLDLSSWVRSRSQETYAILTQYMAPQYTGVVRDGLGLTNFVAGYSFQDGTQSHGASTAGEEIPHSRFRTMLADMAESDNSVKPYHPRHYTAGAGLIVEKTSEGVYTKIAHFFFEAEAPIRDFGETDKVGWTVW